MIFERGVTMRKFIIKATKQITLPVTPESFEVSYGRRTETINIHETGDVNLPGGMALGTIKISCLFPANDYPFATDYGSPYDYIEAIEKIIKKKKPVRFVVSGTPINEKVLIEEICYGEKDGTGDVYATLTLRGYCQVSVGTAEIAAYSRPGGEGSVSQEQSYSAVYGDCLCFICRKFYGDGSYTLAQKLADYNGRADPNILYVGEVLKIPPKSVLMG